jgi:hypothetical protein
MGRNSKSSKQEVKESIEIDYISEEKPIPFGYKCCWLAIKSTDIEGITSALNLSSIEETNWTKGLEEAYEASGKVFVSPALDNWVLVIGISLPDAGGSRRKDSMTPLLVKLSAKFGEVQYFATHRVVDYHAWAKVIDQNIVRAYAYLGESGSTLWNVGELTEEEKELGFSFFDESSEEAENDEYWEREDLSYPDEENVMDIAKKWSIDTSFENADYPVGKGLIGKLNIE